MKMEATCKHNSFEVVLKEETYPVFGEETTILANVKVCKKCGTDIFDPQLDNENLKKAFLKYKKNHALMTSDEIVALRNKYGISQRTLATLIGCSQATLVRYEKGDIQNNTHNNILRMLNKPENMLELLDVKEDELSEREANAIRQSIDGYLARKNNELIPIENIGTLIGIKADQYSGFKEFDFTKFTQMIMFFADNVSGLYKTKLFKLLFYADMYYFKENTLSISGMNYIHQHYGPVPREYNLLLGLIEKNGNVRIEEVDTQYGVGEIIRGTNKHSYDALSEDELNVMEKVCRKYGNMSAGEISECSHMEKGYMNTLDLEMISYKYAMEM